MSDRGGEKMRRKNLIARSVLITLALAGAGCVHAVFEPPSAQSTAFDTPLDTAFGRRVAPRLAAHPEESGLYVLSQGRDAFAARWLMIDRAERALDVQYYIFHDDLTGRLLLGRLLAAADRGVRVRLLLDDLGTTGIDAVLAAANAHPNLEVRLFNALARGPSRGLARTFDLLSHPRRLNHRMHNKMLSADGVVAVVGGRNVGDEYFDAASDVNFADLDLLVVGPALEDLGESFDLYWNAPFVASLERWSFFRAGSDELASLQAELVAHEESARESPYAARVRSSSVVEDVESGRLPLLWAPTHAVADLPAKIVAKGDAIGPTLLTRRVGPLFRESQTQLDIVSPYFVPRKKGVEFLRQTVARGVRVRILTNSLAATDVTAVHAGYGKRRAAMIEGGVELYELRRTGEWVREAQRKGAFGSSSASLHAKTFAIDERTVFIGSMNLDPRSLDLNTELGLVVESPELAKRRAAVFDRAIDGNLSWRVGLEERGGVQRLYWKGLEGDDPVHHTTEPDTSWWRRFKVSLLSLLPIEGQI